MAPDSSALSWKYFTKSLPFPNPNRIRNCATNSRNARPHLPHSNPAIRDVRDSVKLLNMALYFAWSDTKARYRRSVLGPFWIVLGTAFGVTGLAYLWSEILKVDRATLVPSLTIGLVVWFFISGVFADAPSAFVRNAHIIRNIRSPFLIFALQLLIRQLITFGHNFLLVAVVMAIYVRNWSWIQLLFFPGIILVCVNLLWITTVMATLGARFRDLEPLVGAIMPMLFFLSPVVYRPEYLPADSLVLLCNPLAYFITALREPLQGVVPQTYIYVGLVLMAPVGWTLALSILAHRYTRIAFWM
jgi:homopolymeric O-antigen transport system permease protein